MNKQEIRELILNHNDYGMILSGCIIPFDEQPAIHASQANTIVSFFEQADCLKELLRSREKLKVIRQLHKDNLLQAFSDEAQWKLEEAIKED